MEVLPVGFCNGCSILLPLAGTGQAKQTEYEGGTSVPEHKVIYGSCFEVAGPRSLYFVAVKTLGRQKKLPSLGGS